MKNPSQPHPTPKILSKPPVQEGEDDIEEILPAVKSEPRDNTTTAPIETVVQHEQGMDMYNDRTQQMGSMKMTMDAEQYDDSYGGTMRDTMEIRAMALRWGKDRTPRHKVNIYCILVQ
jgi:hypothetical protein